MLKNNFIQSSLIFLSLILFQGNGFAQVGASSPYSKYGIGNLSHINNLRSISMGGLSLGVRNPNYVNFENPSSYTSFDSTSFIFEGGLAGQRLSLASANDQEIATSFSVSHFLFGFPVTDWWRASFGLMPYSNVDYDISDLDSSNVFGEFQSVFEGRGGINRFYLGNAMKIGDFLSLGVNFNYLFGSYQYSLTQTFIDSTQFLDTRLDNTISVSDYYFDYGLQFHKRFDNGYNIILGAVYNNQQGISQDRTYMARNFFTENNNVINVIDTVKFETLKDQQSTMPQSYGFGLTVSNNKWLVGADYQWKEWSAFETDDSEVLLNDAFEVSAGAEYSPSDFNSISYWQKINYRLGARYTNSYLNLKDTQIDDFGITFGLGLPIRSIALRGTKARFNVAVELGSRGSKQNDLIQENYFNTYFSVSIYEWWFIKRKFD